MVQHVGHELRVLAVARSGGGQGKDGVHHQVWLVSLSLHAIWPVQRSCDIPAYHEPRAVGTYLGECDRLLRRCERHRQDLPRKSGQPESRAVPVPEVWTEAEVSEVHALQAWDRVSRSESGWRRGARNEWPCPGTRWMARANTKKVGWAVLGVCELPQGIHSGLGQDHRTSVRTDGSKGKMEGKMSKRRPLRTWRKSWSLLQCWHAQGLRIHLSWTQTHPTLLLALYSVRSRTGKRSLFPLPVRSSTQRSMHIALHGRSCWQSWYSPDISDTTCWGECFWSEQIMQAPVWPASSVVDGVGTVCLSHRASQWDQALPCRCHVADTREGHMWLLRRGSESGDAALWRMWLLSTSAYPVG